MAKILGNHSKRAHARKAGPGRYHRDGLETSTKIVGQRAYRALMTHFAGKRLSKPGNKRGLGLV